MRASAWPQKGSLPSQTGITLMLTCHVLLSHFLCTPSCIKRARNLHLYSRLDPGRDEPGLLLLYLLGVRRRLLTWTGGASFSAQKGGFMAFSATRHAAVDVELQRIQSFLEELALEIETVALLRDKRGFTYQVAVQIGDQVELLRAMLADDQKRSCYEPALVLQEQDA
jgi:hypothetical protein